MSQKETKVIIVHQKEDHQALNINNQCQQADPLVQQLKEMKLTSNLVKQIVFNSTVNKFQYLEQLLSVQYKSFDNKITQVASKQKQLMSKNIKTMHKDIGRITNQLLKPKQNSNTLLNNKPALLDLHKKAENAIQTKKDSEKFLKLSQGMNIIILTGMLSAVLKIQKELDEHVKSKLQAMNANNPLAKS